MDRNGYEEELDLILLSKAVLKNWKKIISIALICAVIAVVYQFATASKSAMVSTGESTSNTEAMNAYEQSVAEIDAEIESYKSDIASYKDQKEEIKKDLETLEEEQNEVMKESDALDAYRKKSVILNIDPYNAATKTRTYYVSNDYQIMPGMDYQNVNPKTDIVNLYTAAAISANADINEVLHTATGTNNDKKVALCSVTQGALYGAGDTTYNNSSCFTIITIGEDDISADNYMNRAVKAVEDVKDSITEEVGEHELILMDQSSYVGLNSDLKDAQEAFGSKIVEELDQIVSQRNTLNTRITTLNSNIHSATAGIQTQEKNKIALEKPSSEIVTSSGVSKAGVIKWLMIGALVGMLLACIWFAIDYIASGALKSENELEGRYGIKMIGYSKDPISLSVAAASIKALMKEKKDVLIISSLGREICEKLAEQLKNQYPEINTIVAGNIGKDPAGIDALSEVNGVVIMEKTGVSKNADIAYEVKIISGTGIDILGCVM